MLAKGVTTSLPSAAPRLDPRFPAAAPVKDQLLRSADGGAEGAALGLRERHAPRHHCHPELEPQHHQRPAPGGLRVRVEMIERDVGRKTAASVMLTSGLFSRNGEQFIFLQKAIEHHK